MKPKISISEIIKQHKPSYSIDDSIIIDHDSLWVIYDSYNHCILCRNERLSFYNLTGNDGKKEGFEILPLDFIDRELNYNFDFKSSIIYPNKNTAEKALSNLIDKLNIYFPECKDWKVKQVITTITLK